MKINLPLTGVERMLDPAKPVVTKTDLKGRITYVNQAFVDISGFTHDELIGQSHNIVRHPDMPPEAFADLWRTIGAGHPWRGLVKNRVKNGDHYWVEAYVTPITEEGRCVGYMSVRSRPRPADVDAAEALYRRVRNKDTPFPATRHPDGASPLPLAAGAGLAALLAIAGGWLDGWPGLACGTLAAALVAGGVMALQRRVFEPMRRVSDIVSRLDEGRLDLAIEPTGGPADSVLVRLEALRIHLRALFADVLVSAAEVEARSRRLDEAMQILARAAEAQHDSVQEVSAATEQMSVSVSEIAAGTDQAVAAARRNEEVAGNGLRSGAAGIEGARRTAAAVTESTRRIGDFNGAIARIADISTTIRDVANQTNLLALNAAIEAARAGDHGRGFAVVADEVRSLSERTANSTGEIAAAVASIIEQSRAAVASMADVNAEVAGSASRVEETNGQLQVIFQASRDALALNDELAATLRQQAAAVQAVAQSMERISAAAESGRASIAEVGSSASGLRGTADELRALLRHMEGALQGTR